MNIKKTAVFPRYKLDGQYPSSQIEPTFPGGERVVFNIPNILLGEAGRSGEIQVEKESKLLPIDEGVLIFTPRRILYFGERKSLEILTDEIITLKSMENGLIVSSRSEEKIYCFWGLPYVPKWFICIYLGFP